ncbi:MAG: HAMP domain-containing sensor histidine kinase [Hyphomicrobiales bacterium]
MSDTAVQNSADKTALNRRRSERRREVSRTIKDVREQLTSETGTRPQFDYELMLMYAKNRQGASFAMPVFAIIVAGALSVSGDQVAAGAWLMATLITHALVLYLCSRFERTADANTRLRGWRTRFALAEFLHGISWAGAMMAAPHADGPAALEIFEFGTMLVIIAVSTMLASNLPVAVVAATTPLTAILALHFGIRGDSLYLAMAIMAVGAQMFFLVLAGRMQKTTLTMLEYRAEKDSLIGELEQAKAISDESRRRAEEANLAKSRFLATMSHELRTPLNAILGFSEVMKSEIFGPLPNQQYKDYASDIHSSGQHLLNLINEILDLSRIEAGRQELNEEAVNLSHLVEDCNYLLQIKAKNKNLQITEQFEPGLPRLWADERAIRQVVLNLLSNAIKFTPTGGQIWLKVGWTAGGGQYVAVKDSGPGVPEEEIPVVLSAFGQGSLAIKSAEPGTGLGLPIVQALVKMHGGSFDFRSKLREGTEVTITFPRTRVMEALGPIDEEADARAAQRAARRALLQRAS